MVAADPGSSLGSWLLLGLGGYWDFQITRSNSLPSGSANVVQRTAGSLVSLSVLAPWPVSGAGKRGEAGAYREPPGVLPPAGSRTCLIPADPSSTVW